MILRSRGSKTHPQSSNVIAKAQEDRSVLGDVSNKSLPSKQLKEKTVKKIKILKKVTSTQNPLEVTRLKENNSLERCENANEDNDNSIAVLQDDNLVIEPNDNALKSKTIKRLKALNPFENKSKDASLPENKNRDDGPDDEENLGLRRSRRVKNTRTFRKEKRKHESPATNGRKIKNVKFEKGSTCDSESRASLPQESNCFCESNSESDQYDVAGNKEQPFFFGKTLVPETHCMQSSFFDGRNQTIGIAPHDRNDTEDVLKVANYVTDLFQHLYLAETTSCPKKYMGRQNDINEKMRAILVDWLVEVHMKFRLVPDTLYLCINIIDRYCSIVAVPRNKLQLVGVTALLIACKYEEIYPPEVRDCVYITDRAYQREEVLSMEQDILARLHYKISVPTAYPFILRFLSVTNATPLTRAAAYYYVERTLQEHDILQYRPSVVSASSVLLALSNPDVPVKEMKTMQTDVLIQIQLLLEYTKFSFEHLVECSSLIARKVGEQPVTASRRQLVSVKRKYDHRRFYHVSTTIGLPDSGHIPELSEICCQSREKKELVQPSHSEGSILPPPEFHSNIER